MPILETRHVKATRKDRTCDDCGKPLPKGSTAVAMFGMVHEGEKPWWMYTHARGTCPNPSLYTQAQIEKHPGADNPLGGLDAAAANNPAAFAGPDWDELGPQL